MQLVDWLDKWGEGPVLVVMGALTGLVFGFMAQRSRFCLRAAVLEFWHRQPAQKLVVWLLAFSTAVIAVQALEMAGWLDTGQTRQMTSRGSLSGALIGGLMFGAGMVMARGCASRLLILSAGGNLRALLSGLVFAVTAQAALSGALSPLRETVAAAWTLEGGPSRDLLRLAGLDHGAGLMFGMLWLAAAHFCGLARSSDDGVGMGGRRGHWCIGRRCLGTDPLGFGKQLRRAGGCRGRHDLQRAFG